jgi:hypothetical protein
MTPRRAARTCCRSPLVAIAVLALVACGGDDESTAPDGISVAEETSTTSLPTETTLAPGTTTAATVDESPTTGTPSTPAPTDAPTTPPAPTTAAPSDLYRVVTPPTPATTDPIDPAWIEDNGETLGTDIADGVYWGTIVGTFEGAEGPGISFELSQVFFGDDCTAQFGTGDDVCLNDYQELPEPRGELPAYVASLQYVTVADVIDNEISYLIDGAELYRMASGRPPSAGAPEYWALAPFPYLVTVRDGTVISVEQVWLP